MFSALVLVLQCSANATYSYNLINYPITKMISEGERRVKILDYVRQNSTEPQVTKSDVMRHMKDVSRAMTTHKTTIELIKEGKIKMVKPKDKPYSQIDYLVINEENEFNKINGILLEFQYFITKLEKTMDKIRTTFKNVKKDQEDPEYQKVIGLDGSFMTWYRHIFDNLLQNTLIRISRSKLSAKDRQYLINLVVGQINKLNDTYRLHDQPNLGPSLREDIDMMEEFYKISEDHKRMRYLEKYDIDLKLINELASIVEKSIKINLI